MHTTQGQIFHANAHEGLRVEKRGTLLIVRHMHVTSHTLGISGVCDVVEFHADKGGITLYGREGLWQPVPVEYKKGRPHAFHADSLQLCAQALCLEEMLVCSIPEAYLYYGEPRQKIVIKLDEDFRKQVKTAIAEMHDLYERQYTPRVKKKKECLSCSLAGVCLPVLEQAPSAKNYLLQHIKGVDDA